MPTFNQPNIERKNCVWTTKCNSLLEMCIVQQVERQSVFTFQPIKRLVSLTVKSAKPAATFWSFFLRIKNRHLCCLAVRVRIILPVSRVTTTKKKKHLHFWRNFSANHKQANPNPHQKKLKLVQIWNKRIRLLLADDLSNIFIFQLFLFKINLLSTSQLTINSQKNMIFPVSNDGVRWTLDFGPDSISIAVNDVVQNITISSQELPLAAMQLLLSQRQDFLDNHLARVPVTPNQQGTHEKRDEVLSIVGAQDLDTSSYQLTDLEDIEFNWEHGTWTQCSDQA